MTTRTLIAALALTGVTAFAQTKPQPTVEVQMILTVADHINHHPAALKPGDVKIVDATVTDLIPFENGRDLDLFILIDDAANYDFGAKLKELRGFVATQPDSVSIGVGYIHDGQLQIAENPTTDHDRVLSALRAPSGSKAGNPYCALSDLMQRWPQKSLRHEVVLISTGVDDTASEGAVCVNAETAIHDAERSGTMIFALYNPVADYASQKWSKVDSGVVDLAHVCYETGGESYFVGHTPMESMAPFLTDIAEHLEHQYLVKFRVSPEPMGAFRSIYFNNPSSPDREFMKPESVWVPAAAAHIREH